MSTRDLDILENLIKTKSGKTNPKDEKNFRESWVNLAKSEGYSERAEKFLYQGLVYSGAKPFKNYLDLCDDKKKELLGFFNGAMYQRNSSTRFRLFIHLFALTLNDRKCWEFVPIFIEKLPTACVNQEEKILADIDQMMTKYFFGKLIPEAHLPAIETMEIKTIVVSEFVEIMSKTLKSINKEELDENKIRNIKKVQQWIDSCRDAYVNKSIKNTDSSRKSSEQKVQSRQTNISKSNDKTEPSSEKKPKNENNKGSKKEKVQPESSKVVVDTSKGNQKDTAQNSDSQKQESPAVKSSPAKPMKTNESASKAVKEGSEPTTPNRSDNKKEAMDLESPVSDAETIDRQKTQTIAPAEKETLPKDETSRVLSNDNDADKDCIALMAKAMDSVNAVIKEKVQLKAKANSLAQELDKKETELSYANKMIQELRDEIGRISKRLNISIGENAQLQKELAAKDELISQKETELSERIEFAEVLDRDRKQQDNEAMQRIASKIKVEYRDFQDAEDIPVDCDLGENLKLQLQSIFDILEKGGIKFK